MAVSGGREIVCDVDGIVEADATTVDALARLQLAAKRSGFRLRLRNPPRELTELLLLTGLAEVLGVEPRRQAEEREERVRVEEERELADLAVLDLDHL